MIIGSKAIKHYFEDFPRVPKDIDIIKHDGLRKVSYDERVEYLENPVLISWVYNTHCVLPNNYCFDNLPIPLYCPLDELYSLKISHVIGWDNNWEKYMWDIQWLKEKGCKFIPELFYELYEYWNNTLGKNKRSLLDMTASEFFDNAVNYPFPHDDLHEMLVQHEYFKEKIPTYKKILIAEVDVSMEKFNNLTELEKFNVVFEEVAVMALERYGNMYYKKAFSIMLKKFILSHAKLEEALWIIENHKILLNNIPFNFIKFLKNGKDN